MNSRKVALALSGGGARGMAHVGVINELLSRGYEIHSIAGCSIGSVVGAMYAMGKLREFADFILADGAEAVFAHLDFTLSDQGFIKGQKMLDRLQEFAPDCNIEDLPVKLTIVATDMNTGEDVVYDSGSVYRAIRASVAIPAVLTAVHEEGRWLVDGGVVNPLPLLQLQRSEYDLAVAVNLYASPIFASETPSQEWDDDDKQVSVLAHLRERFSELRSWKSNLVQTILDDPHQKKGYFTTLRLMSELASKRLAEETVRRYPLDALIEIPIASCGLFRFDLADAMIDLGRSRAVAALNSMEQQLHDRRSVCQEQNYTKSTVGKRKFSWLRLLGMR